MSLMRRANARQGKARLRVQLDLLPAEVRSLDELRDACRLRSRADAVKVSLGLLEWIRNETSAGHRIVSVGNGFLSQLAVPGITV